MRWPWWLSLFSERFFVFRRRRFGRRVRRIESSVGGGWSRWEGGDGGLDFFAVFLRIGGDPGLDRGAADGRVNEADGDAERVVEFAAEEIQCGGKGADALGGAKHPTALAGGLRGIGVRGFFFKVADERKIGGAFFGLVILCAVDGHGHVGLTGAEPDFADEHVLNGDRVGALDRQRTGGGAGGETGEGDLPGAVAGCGGSDGLAGEVDGDFLAGRGGAPDGDTDVALEDHVVGEDGGQ